MSLSSKLAAAIKFRIKYVKFFGPINTAQILFARLTGRKLFSFAPPGYSLMYLRPGTTDAKTMMTIFVDNEYDLPYVEDARFIIDGGANVGYSAHWFAKRFPGALILAVEAEQANYELLTMNATANPASNIIPIHAALWNKMETVHIANPDAGAWAFQVQEGGSNEGQVQGMTVDHLLDVYGRDKGLLRVDILKLNIEGGEKELFESNTESWLSQVDTIVIELHDWIRQGCSAAVMKATEQIFHIHTRQGANLMLMRMNTQQQHTG